MTTESGRDVHAGTADAVLFDFSGTLFYIESAEQALRASLGPDFVALAPRLRELGAINGSSEPSELPEHLRGVWESRDLSADAHRAAYSGLARHGGLDAAQAAALYERGISPDAWRPYSDTEAVLHELHDRGVPVAVISNIGWDPRPVLDRYGVSGLVDVLVLSDEEGVIKPDPEIFRRACQRLGVDPRRCVMIGDNTHADSGGEALGIRFVLVSADPARRAPDELGRAVGVPPGR